MRIFHQRHKNWLHLLFARVLFVRLTWSKVQDIPETFFVTYHQETIVKSSQLLQNMLLNTHSVVRLGYYHHRWVNYLDTSNIGEFFFKNDTTSSKEYGQKDIVYIGDFCILKSASSTDARSFQMWLEWSQFKLYILEQLCYLWAVTCGFQQCVILTSVDSGEPVQPPFKLRNSKRC